jgi:hypothetical protein
VFLHTLAAGTLPWDYVTYKGQKGAGRIEVLADAALSGSGRSLDSRAGSLASLGEGVRRASGPRAPKPHPLAPAVRFLRLPLACACFRYVASMVSQVLSVQEAQAWILRYVQGLHAFLSSAEISLLADFITECVMSHPHMRMGPGGQFVFVDPMQKVRRWLAMCVCRRFSRLLRRADGAGAGGGVRLAPTCDRALASGGSQTANTGAVA